MYDVFFSSHVKGCSFMLHQSHMVYEIPGLAPYGILKHYRIKKNPDTLEILNYVGPFNFIFFYSRHWVKLCIEKDFTYKKISVLEKYFLSKLEKINNMYYRVKNHTMKSLYYIAVNFQSLQFSIGKKLFKYFRWNTNFKFTP